MTMQNPVLAMISYAFLLLAAGVFAYLKLLPVDLLVATFYLVAGHAGANLPGSLSSSSTPTASIATAPQKPAGGENAPAY